jgi:hypothetical protein
MSAKAIDKAVIKGLAIPKLSRRKLNDTKKWPQWRQQEWGQLTKCDLQEMFVRPMPRSLDRNTVILPWYGHASIKSTRIVWKKLKKREEHATAVNDTEKRSHWPRPTRHASNIQRSGCSGAITASEGLITLGCDVANAFAEAPPPTVPFYMEVDDQFGSETGGLTV